MSDHTIDSESPDMARDGSRAARSLLDKLLTDSRLYTRGRDYQELLSFVVRLRNFAPFNAMLLQIQKPGLSYAASARDWRERFGRYPLEGARPLLILLPFGPVALVYDVLDTQGNALPQDVSSFFAQGEVSESSFSSFKHRLERKNIDLHWIDAGDYSAGQIRVVTRPTDDDDVTRYRISVNRNHSLPTKFVTITHELGHLCLGHLGSDTKLEIRGRPSLGYPQAELEAESVAYIVCGRNGVESNSYRYLSTFVEADTTVDYIGLYQVMRAAGQVEALLGLAVHTRFDRALESV